MMEQLIHPGMIHEHGRVCSPTCGMIKLLMVCTTLCCVHQLRAQGCSDAGFCSINTFRHDNTEADSANIHHLKIGSSFGVAQYSVLALAGYVEYSTSISHSLQVDAKLTGIIQTGNGITSGGVSDLFLNSSLRLASNMKLIAGVKLPFSPADVMQAGRALPMDYQPSLGTIDCILGFTYHFEEYRFIVAAQVPLTQNRNEFLAEVYPAQSPLRVFPSTSGYRRSSDIMARLSRTFNVSADVKVTPGLLPIYHVTNDRYRATSEETREIDGSRGLTFNVLVYLDYRLSSTRTLQFSAGFPLVVRSSRPDGLTRSFIATMEYGFRL